MDVVEYNRNAWDKQVQTGNPWTVPVSPEIIAAARRGEWSVVLTAGKVVPRNWFPEKLGGVEVLCLASGGGQQAPILAAAGAKVIVFDNSPAQLARDREVAKREGLEIVTVQGDMADLSAFANGSFELVFHPVSNVFVPDVRPVWKEAYRVLRNGGVLLSGFMNPVLFTFDYTLYKQGIFQVRHALPYSDLHNLSVEERKQQLPEDAPLEFSHTYEALIGGQLEAGFLLSSFYEDIQPGERIGEYIPNYFATRAVKQS
jgi:SAM-dependent methyltransferase